MKEKIKNSLPYVLIAIVFAAIIAVNGMAQPTESKFSFKLTSTIPQISENDESIINTNKNSEKEDVRTESKDVDQEDICYHTNSGTKYHLNRECRYIKNSSSVNQTTISEAVNFGFEPCTGCAE